MSKLKPVRKSDKGDEDKQPVIVTTSLGARIECLPIQGAIDELNVRFERQKSAPPTYIMKDVSGTEITFDYDEHSILGDNVPDEDKKKWRDYIAECIHVDAERNEHIVRLLAVRGVRVLDMPPEEQWVAEHKWLYGSVPDDPLERKLHYFKTEVGSTSEDGMLIMKGIFEASGLNQEVLQRMEDSFRSSVGQAGRKRADADGDSPDTQ